MHISVLCPSCQTRYQLDDSMLGQRMRCPNTACREVFEVKDAGPVTPPPRPNLEPLLGQPAVPAVSPNRPAAGPVVPPEAIRTRGSVGQVVPILSAQMAGPAPATLTPPAPPPRPNKVNEPLPSLPVQPSEPRKAVVPPPRPVVGPPPDAAVVVPPGEWQPPPVRDGDIAPGPTEPPAERLPVPEEAPAPIVQRRRQARRLMIGIAATVILVLGTFAGVGYWYYLGQEGRLARQAQQEYDQGHFAQAAGIYDGLLADFPSSQHRDEYRFSKALSDVRTAVYVNQAKTDTTLDQLGKLLTEQRDNPLLASHARDLGETFVKALGDFTEANKDNPTRETLQTTAQAEKLLADLAQRFPDAVADVERKQIAANFDGIRQSVARTEQRDQLLSDLRKLAERPGFAAIQTARQQIQKETATQPGLDKNADVDKGLTALYQAHFDAVRYVPAPVDAALLLAGPLEQVPYTGLAWNLPTAPPEDAEPATLLTPAPILEGLVPRESTNDQIFPALARGVLYFLPQSGATPLWAIRLGIDTTVLPLRLPATASVPERFLAVSADSRQVLLLNPRARRVLWQKTLATPCLGRPLVLDNSAFLPLLGGDVVEIDLTRGDILGRYLLGQRLTTGGTRQENTGLLFFPAEEGCVYVLDAYAHRCRAVLYTEHPAGSLHGEPAVLNWGTDPGAPTREDSPGWLILAQSNGLEGTRLRTFSLPLATTPGPVAARADLPVPGWSWFSPHCDSEKLVVVTDDGAVGLFGLPWPRQPSDAPYPWLAELYRVPNDQSPNQVMRAQLVYVQDRSFWVLANDVLHHLELAFHRVKGWQMASLWTRDALGIPLQPGQTDDEGRRLFLVTQALTGQDCQALAIQTDNGRTLWRRQLGLVARGQPLLLRRGGETFVLITDQGGGLFLFDPGNPEFGGRMIAPPFSDPVAGMPYLFAGDAGSGSAWEVACTRDRSGSYKVQVRSYGADGRTPEPLVDRWQPYDVPAALAGPPALGDRYLLLPLADGSLVGLARGGTAKPETFPDWRVRQADAHARATVHWLNADEYLTSDGERGLTRWRWSAGQKRWQGVPQGRDFRTPTLELPARLVGAPLLLMAAKEGEEPSLLLADESGKLSLRQGESFGTEVRRWTLNGAVTSGPFARGDRIGVILDRRRLLWIDPTRDAPLWDRDLGQAIVGEPQTAGAVVLVADQSGRYRALDAITGEERGPGYSLRSSVAPAATPVPFGTDRVLAPLSDGMIMLLPRDLFGTKAPKR